MPELPEVETVCRGLQQSIKGAIIDQVTLRRKNIRTAIPAGFAQQNAGARIVSIKRRAKYILIQLDNAHILLIHLGMSGRIKVLNNLPKQLDKHDHVLWHLQDGRMVIYNDPRRFGVVTICKNKDIMNHPLLKGLGVEPLEAAFSAAYLLEQCKRRKQSIKPLLMDQKIVVGVGNIYASEALFDARISPERPANTLTLSDCKRVIESVRKVLNAAIKSGGSTLRNYQNSAGEEGYFQHKFQIYNRHKEACFICKQPIMRIMQAGRATYFCKKCQK